MTGMATNWKSRLQVPPDFITLIVKAATDVINQRDIHIVSLYFKNKKINY
jgi:hypothetical protein